MRKKLLAALMAILVCGASVPPVNAGAKSIPNSGKQSQMPYWEIGWGSYWNGWYNDNENDGYNQDDVSGADDEYWYDTTDWYDDDDSSDGEEGYWYDVGDWYDNDDDSDVDDEYWYDTTDWYDDDDGGDDEEDELTIYDIAVNPKKKEIKKGKSFYISLVPADKSEWEGFTEAEWDEICEENIESIEYSSTKKSVASVNGLNGKVKARKKGTAVIKTTINLENEESVTFKTKVTVKK